VLRPIWLQLPLFPFHQSAIVARAWSSGYSGVSDSERDGRTGRQWLLAVRSYLEFCCGDAWRSHSDPSQKNSPERWWYLNGIRTLNGIQSANQVPCIHIVHRPAPADPRINALAAHPRAELVDELLRVNPSLYRKLLLRLSRAKHAVLLIDACDRASAEMERST
jgi:hypothetical protein